MSIRFEFNGNAIGQKFSQAIIEKYGRVADATRDAANEARDQIKFRGDINILSAGNFSKRWTDSFLVTLSPARGRTANITIRASSTIPYFMIHERGGTIVAKNPSGLLWIPLPWSGIKSMWAGEYGRRYGLFRVDRQGKNPLLFSMRDKEAKYVGVPNVTLRKRFHIGQIIREVSRQIPAYYKAAFSKRRR